MCLDIVRYPMEGRVPGRRRARRHPSLSMRFTGPIMESLDGRRCTERPPRRNVGRWSTPGAFRGHACYTRISCLTVRSASFRSDWHATTSLAPRLTGRRRSFS